jgi:hypothetical protein
MKLTFNVYDKHGVLGKYTARSARDAVEEAIANATREISRDGVIVSANGYCWRYMPPSRRPVSGDGSE